MPLDEVQAERSARWRTGIGELDRVLGGGLVPGSVVLVGGPPGIGKSTLTGSALGNLAASGRRVLYLSAEESAAQVRLRAERLGEAALSVPVSCESELEAALEVLESCRPEVCVVDSVQTVHSAELSGAPGSVGQVRHCASMLTELAKRTSCALLLVGHVTKDGAVAGPKVLEHLVDVVLLFEGEGGRSLRMLRALKNRFGATQELGVFEMVSEGLVEVEDASARLAAVAEPAAGSIVLCAIEGTRPLLVEVQALVAPTEIVQPRRVANGIDRNRLAMVLAVLDRHAGIGLGSHDVFVNIAGGVRVEEPGADLAVALAIASAQSARPLTSPGGGPIACFGEIALTGDLRSVAAADRRLAEARKLGIESVVLPASETAAGVAQTAPRTLREALAIVRRTSAGPRAQIGGQDAAAA